MKRFMKKVAVFAIALAAAVTVAGAGISAEAAAKKPTKITLKSTATTVDIKGKVTVSVKSVKPSGASKSVAYTTSNKKVATVNSKGVVTGVKKGTAKITATSKVNKKVKATINIKVVEPFTGKYVISAADLKKKIDAKQSMILVDTRGINSKTVTAKKAITMTWQDISKTEKTDGTKSGQAGFARSLSASEMGKRLGKFGLGLNDQIILFSEGYATTGWGDDGRIAWQLLQCGYKNVKIVNGGLPAMKAVGIATQTGPSKAKAKQVTIAAVDTTTHDVTTEELKANFDSYKIIDVRADKEYKGATLYGETSGGHIKGAIHIRFTDLFKADGTLKNRADLEKMFAAKGLKKTDKVATYCTGGIRSAYMQLVLQMLGYEDSHNYAESAYRWSNTASAGTGSLWTK